MAPSLACATSQAAWRWSLPDGLSPDGQLLFISYAHTDMDGPLPCYRRDADLSAAPEPTGGGIALLWLLPSLRSCQHPHALSHPERSELAPAEKGALPGCGGISADSLEELPQQGQAEGAPPAEQIPKS